MVGRDAASHNARYSLGFVVLTAVPRLGLSDSSDRGERSRCEPRIRAPSARPLQIWIFVCITPTSRPTRVPVLPNTKQSVFVTYVCSMLITGFPFRPLQRPSAILPGLGHGLQHRLSFGVLKQVESNAFRRFVRHRETMQNCGDQVYLDRVISYGREVHGNFRGREAKQYSTAV